MESVLSYVDCTWTVPPGKVYAEQTDITSCLRSLPSAHLTDDVCTLEGFRAAQQWDFEDVQTVYCYLTSIMYEKSQKLPNEIFKKNGGGSQGELANL